MLSVNNTVIAFLGDIAWIARDACYCYRCCM